MRALRMLRRPPRHYIPVVPPNAGTCVFDDSTCIILFNIFLHAWISVGGNAVWNYAIGTILPAPPLSPLSRRLTSKTAKTPSATFSVPQGR